MTQDYIDGIFERLSEMNIELDPNPLEFGPGALNEKTATVRSMLSDTERVFMEVSHNLHKYKRDLLVGESTLKIAMTRLMAEDPHVRSGRSQQEREALALLRLTDHTEKIDAIKLNVASLEEVMKIIKAKRTDLKDIQGRLRDQLKLCQEQLALGERWGGRAHISPESEIIRTKPQSRLQEEIELDRIFAEAITGGNNEEGPTEGSVSDPDNPITGVNVSSQVEDFLETDLGPEKPNPFQDDEGIDFDGLLDDIL